MMDSGNIKIDRYNPPLSKELPVFKFPAYTDGELKNKIKLYIVEDSTQPLLSIRILVNKGAVNEPVWGLAGFVSQLMLRGTSKRTAAQVAEETDFLGIALNASSNWDDSTVSLIGLAEYIEKGLDILSDCLLNPVFADEEIERLKKKHISNIHQEYADPNYLVQSSFNAMFYRDHPYGHPAVGTPGTIGLITRQDCLGWYDNFLNNSQISIIAAGNASGIDLPKMLDKYLGSLKSNSSKIIAIDRPAPWSETRIAVVNKPDVSQTALKFGKPAINRTDPDYPLLQLANTIFGGYFLSRLNYSLREVHGYTYGIHSSIESRKHFSALTVSSNINKDASAFAVEEIISEMSKISLNPVSEEELYRASQYVLGSFVRVVETPQQISTLIHSLVVNGLEPGYYDDFYSKIAHARLGELMEAQEKYFKPEHLVITSVGEQESLSAALSRFGEVNTVDEAGNIIV